MQQFPAQIDHRHFSCWSRCLWEGTAGERTFPPLPCIVETRLAHAPGAGSWGGLGCAAAPALGSLSGFTSPLHRSRRSPLLPLSPVPEAAAVPNLYLD